MRRVALLAALLLGACNGGQGGESDPAVIANHAESLQKAADETTDALVNQLDAEGALAPEPEGNGSEAAK